MLSVPLIVGLMFIVAAPFTSKLLKVILWVPPIEAFPRNATFPLDKLITEPLLFETMPPATILIVLEDDNDKLLPALKVRPEMLLGLIAVTDKA
jgi:hypothetical protein